MIKIFGPKEGSRHEEEKKNAEEGKTTGTRRKTPGEIRLGKELNELDLPENVVIDFPDENNICSFNINLTVIEQSSLWNGATYNFTFTVPGGYPHEPPRVHCNTKVYHPNIDLQGNVCLNILRKDWKPVLCISAVILGLNFLFLEPNPEDPLNHDAAALQRDNYS
jgi:ubiquitin-conjugating enzyme E2 M